MSKIVISLGGSLFYKNGVNADFLEKFARIIEKSNAKIAITVGGGKIAKEYIEKGKSLGINNFDLDEIGIQLVKANSRFVAGTIKNALYFESFEEAKNHFSTMKNTIILGTGTPGQTSDTVSSLFAEETEAEKWINLTNVNGIYDKNPKVFKNAKKFKKMTHKQLVELSEKHDTRKPRENFVIDILATKILSRSNIEAHIINGFNLKDFEKALKGESHTGTVVKN